MNSIRTSSTEADQRSLKQPARKGWGRRTGHLPWLLLLLAVAIVVAVGAWAGLSAPVQAQGTADYDRDDDGLIEVSSLAQLNAIRWDLDGDGSTTDTGYASAFPNAVSGMGCPSAGCTGYELDADLDFDTNGNGEADSGDDYWNDGSGWTPIGTQSSRISTTFDGNGHTISGLFINRGSTDDVGLFGYIDSSSVIRNTSLLSVNITGYSHVGALVGWNRGSITASDTFGSVTGNEYVGGLVGVNRGTIDASYASGSVIGNDSVGGLVGWNSSGGAITASYASGSVTGTGGDVGGLVGYTNAGTITASYWDTETSGQPAQTDSSRGIGKTTSQLQAPTGYTGIYAGWNVDIDNADGDDTLSTGGDNPWDFGTASQYPTINYVPSAPVMLSAMRGDGQVTLTWATGSSVLPITKYQFQGDGSGRGWQDIAGSDATTTSYTVTGLNNGQLYTFRVRAVNQAGPGRASGSAAATPIALPDQPVGLRATPDANSVILDWTAASAGENIIKYQYQQGTVSGQVEYDSDWIDVPSSAMGEANHTSYTIDNLEPGQLYTFRVRAVNPVGPGPASDRVTATPQFLVTISMTGYHISSEPLYGDEYQPGETIEFTYTFSEAVTLLPGRQPRVVIAAPGNRYPQAKYDAARSEQAGDDKLVFTWQVPDGVEGRIWVGPGGLGPSRSIGDLNGNVLAPIKLDYGRSAKIGQKSGGPRMEKGTFANAPAQGNHYQPGEHIHVSTRWDRPIKVNADNPPHALIFINSSPNGVRAEYDQALTELQGNRWVMFSYQVQVGDEDDDQLWLGNQDNGVNSLGNAAGITDYSGNVAVDAWEPGSVSRYGATTPSGVPTVSSAGFVFQYQDGQPVVEQLQPGEVLEYRIRFDRPVRVDQSALPYVNIEINSRGAVGAYYDAQRTATFSEPNVLAFTYIVQDGDTDNDRVQVGDNNLQNAGSITDYAGNASTGNGLGTSLGHNVGDSGAPTIVDLEFTSRPLYGGRYQPGEVIEITLTANEPIQVTGGALPHVQMRVENRYPSANYDSVRTAATGRPDQLVFTWTVQDGYSDDNGFLIAPDYFRNTSGVTDWSGNAVNATLPGYWGNDPRHKVGDLGAPVITDLAITSSPASGNAYSSGETIEITLTASEPLTVPTGQEPRLVVEVGSQYPTFRYDRARSQAAGGNQLVFTWTVGHGYQDDNGILGLPDSLRDAGSVVDGSGNALAANLHQYWHFPDQRVDAGAKPARPYNLTATAGDGQVTLDWWDPGNRYITHYRYRQSTDGGVTWEFLGQSQQGWFDIPDSGPATTSYTVPHLTSGVEYTFQIVAINSRNGGGWSNPSRSVRATPN